MKTPEPHNDLPFHYNSPGQQQHEKRRAPQPAEDQPPQITYWPSNAVTSILLSLALIAMGMWAFAQFLALLH